MVNLTVACLAWRQFIVVISVVHVIIEQSDHVLNLWELTKCWNNAGPAAQTLAQRYARILSKVRWLLGLWTELLTLAMTGDFEVTRTTGDRTTERVDLFSCHPSLSGLRRLKFKKL